MSDTFLSTEDVATLTGAKFKSKQIEQLRKMGVLFSVNAQDAPVVPRSAIEGKITIARVEGPKSIPRLFREMNNRK